MYQRCKLNLIFIKLISYVSYSIIAYKQNSIDWPFLVKTEYITFNFLILKEGKLTHIIRASLFLRVM